MFLSTKYLHSYLILISIWICIASCSTTNTTDGVKPILSTQVKETTSDDPNQSSWLDRLFTTDKVSTKKTTRRRHKKTKTTNTPSTNQDSWTLSSFFGGLFSSDSTNDGFKTDPDLQRSTEEKQDPAARYLRKQLAQISTIYVQSFSGENIDQIRDDLYQAIRDTGHFRLVEILPDETTHMAVLRIHIDDYTIWDTEESFPHQNLSQYTDDVKRYVPERIIRRNALIGVTLSLYDAQTGFPLVRGQYSQPFQQIYAGKDIEKMPQTKHEMGRLTKILIIKILNALKTQSRYPMNHMSLEPGVNWGWFADHIHDGGSARINKGNRFAKAGLLDDAVNTWKLVLFSPQNHEPQNIYRLNRASAFYNLGLIYQMKEDHLFAAKMFSQANRLKQTLKYAQAWGDNMHQWIERERRRKNMIPLGFKLPTKKPMKTASQKKPDVILLLESNPNLLLNPKPLWPLEPKIKNATPLELNGTQRTQLDLPNKRFDQAGYIDFEQGKTSAPTLPKRIDQTNHPMDPVLP